MNGHMNDAPHVTKLLLDWRAGEKKALNDLIPLVTAVPLT